MSILLRKLNTKEMRFSKSIFYLVYVNKIDTLIMNINEIK